MVRVSRVVVGLVVIVLAGAMLVGVRPAVGQRSGSGGDGAARLKRAVAQNDLEEISDALGLLLSSGEASGERMALRLLERGTIAQRAVTAGVLGRSGAVEGVGAIASKLAKGKHRDERRWLVGALGRRAREVADGNGEEREERLRAVIRLIHGFVEDSDALVRAAAIRALAETRTPAAFLEAGIRLPPAPGTKRRWADRTEQGIVTWAVYGAVNELLGLRAQSAAEVTACLEARGDEIRAMEPGRVLAPAPRVAGERGALATVRFDVSGKTGVGGGSDLDRVAESTLEACRAWFPGACLPPLRLIITDRQGLAAIGVPPRGFSGVVVGNTIGILESERARMRLTLSHMYVRAVSSSQFLRLPRWFAEGLGQSLTASREGPMFGPGGRPLLREAERLVGRGAFTELVSWSAGAIPDEMELVRYWLAYVVVDYLRFRGFAEPEARLNFLMGMMSRGVPAKRAIEQVYDRPLEALDKDFGEWVRGGE